ncbi:hypothetical protein ES703_63080 [subsurface metagenome]
MIASTVQSYNFGAIQSASDDWAVVAVEFKPVSGVSGNSDYVDFDDVLNEILGSSNNKFVITAWINATTLGTTLTNHGTANCFLAKASSSGNDNLELGITPDGKLHLYLDTDNADTYDDYGVSGSIQTEQWVFIAVRYDNGDVDVLIDSTWYYTSDGGTEPWSSATSIDSTTGALFTIGATTDTVDTDTYFTGYLDEIAVFDETISHSRITDSQLGFFGDDNLSFISSFQMGDKPIEFDLDSVELLYSYRTNISQQIDLSLYNYDTEQYDLIDSSTHTTFFDGIYVIADPDYYNANFEMRAKFDGVNSAEHFNFDLDLLKLNYSWDESSTPVNESIPIIEQYRIIDLNTGQTTDWTEFNSSLISKLAHLGDMPDKFRIEYRVIDGAGNVGLNTTYNLDFEYVHFSTETSITWIDDSIDLNSVLAGERELVFDGSGFGGVESLDVYINGFKYGDAIFDGENYTLSFGTENNMDTLLGYSDSLMSSSIFSNINPLNHISWEYNKDGIFGVVKHVLVDGDIVIINPLTYSTTATMNLDTLYSQSFALQDFVRIRQVYYYNCSSNSTEPIYLTFGDYIVNSSGHIVWSEYSVIHDIYENHSEDIEDDLIYFEYDASEFCQQLTLYNADGFFINFTMPAVFYNHTTIEKLTVSFNDFLGNSFAKVYFDLDLRKYFLDEVKKQYNETIFGLGKMMTIPLYIDLREIILSNPNNLFDLSMLESISLTISDSRRWPSSFVQDYGNYSVLNLPYQRIGIKDIRLYNLISDSIEEANGFVNSSIEFRAPNYYNYYARDSFKIKRIETHLTDFTACYNGTEINGLTSMEYSDSIDLYFRWDGGTEKIPFNDIIRIPIELNDTTSSEVYSFGNIYFMTKEDMTAPFGYATSHYYARIEVPKFLGEYTLSLISNGTSIHKIIIDNPLTLNINVVQESLSESEPIFLQSDLYELEINNPLLLKGCILDNDEYLVEDEVYSYQYQKAVDGETVHQLRVVSPFDDDSFIDKDHFAVYYVSDELKRLPLYVSLIEPAFKEPYILNEDPTICMSY